jgi:flagella basal body P-ring formation protein FlgA
MRPLVKLSAIAALSVLPIASVMASETTSRAPATSLAEAAESFAEEVLGLPSGSARAQSIDRRILLGDCTSGWAWGFAFGSRQSVQVVCPGDPRSRRLVALSFAEESEPKEVAARDAAPMIVATRDLPFGHRLTSGDIREQPLAAGVRPSATLSSPEQVVGQTLTRAVRQGDPLGRADLRAAVVIKRNSIIMGWSDFSGGRVSAKLLALENGKIGEWIDLENPQSGRRLRGEVQTDGSVRLGSPGASTSTMASDAAKVSLARVD